LKGGGDVIVQSIFMLFKKVWDMEEFPSQWMRGVICPLFKGGDVQDCGDYRGIALLSIVGKVLGRVLNSRLMAFAESGEIVEEQFGFRPGRGCVDAAFVFSEVVKGRKDIGKATFCAFIDVRKAYDRVWRDGLWKRLWEAGVKGKMWRVLRALYKEVKSCVMVDGELSEWFETLVGVRQGCVLSPVLYSLFINGFAKFLKEKSVGGVKVAEEWLRLLLFADDIVLFAESEEELQEMLNLLSEYCRRWRFEINVGKSKVMVCGPRGLTTQVTAKWWLAGKEMGRVRVYKYVGMWMNEECTWGDQMAMVREKAMKLTNMMKGWLFKHWGLSVRTKVEVWKAMVGSVLRYGSEVWWVGQNPSRDLEVVQMNACKAIMRISGATSTAFVRGELGLVELERERHVAMLLWYGRLCDMDGQRWAKKLFECEWVGERARGGRTKCWKDVVCDVVKNMY
jgi:hypothetical protein